MSGTKQQQLQQQKKVDQVFERELAIVINSIAGAWYTELDDVIGERLLATGISLSTDEVRCRLEEKAKSVLDEYRPLNTTFDLIFNEISKGKGKKDLEGIASAMQNRLHGLACKTVPRPYITHRLHTLSRYRDITGQLPPGIPQRTAEWYERREQLITASDLAQCIGKGHFGSQRQFIVKKCGYEPQEFNPAVPPLKWGTMFEPVAGQIYETVTLSKIREFGLIPHPSISWLGCSPDGITEDGIMVEIKCPMKRLIKEGYVVEQYFYQVQAQLEVCGLDECDFFEAEFIECTQKEFMATIDSPDVFKGIILERRPDAKSPFEYMYSPMGAATDIALDWVGNVAETGEFDYQRVHFWTLKKFAIQRVYRDQAFIDATLEEALGVWNRVLAYRADRNLYESDGLDGGSSGSSTIKKRFGPVDLQSGGGCLAGYGFLD